jgi:hypothetical protein
MVRQLFMTMLGLSLTAGYLQAQTPDRADQFQPGEVWLDTGGQPIDAHGGGMLYYRGVYYWYGEIMEGKTVHGRVDVTGVSCYSSRDLYHWKNEGNVLPAVKNDPSSDLAPGKVVERPKVVYNPKTQQFVMWMHVDSADYKYARAGLAVSDRPAGPYRYLGSLRPNGSMCRDMTLFQDSNGKAYLIFSSEDNHTMHIARLTNDYLKPDGVMTRVFVDQYREAPAAFQYRGRYFLITSKCSGWAPNAALYAVASSIMGPWKVMGNPTVGPGSDQTFNSQSTYVLPVAGRRGALIFLADRWNADDLADSRHLWLPISIHGDKLEITWLDHWDLSIFR